MRNIQNISKFLIVTIIIYSDVLFTLNAQSTNEAVAYMNLINEQYEDIQKDMWDYVSAMAHSRSARKVEKERIVLLKTINNSIQEVKKMPAFNNDFSLRDSVVAFLILSFNVLNNDFSKIIYMEEVAEQSYDLMEAYFLAQEKVNEKLEIASVRIDNKYRAFAEKYNVTIIESKDEISKKLKQSSEALKYYFQIYLVFFKAYKQEFYLLDALQRSDINSIEQNRNTLLSFAEEGLNSLPNLGHFKGDNSINFSCKRMLTFYKDEAMNKIPIFEDFLMITMEYNEMVALFESKDRMLLTSEEIKKYNNAIAAYKNGINKFNSTNNYLNTMRNNYINTWNNSVDSFMIKHIPKK